QLFNRTIPHNIGQLSAEKRIRLSKQICRDWNLFRQVAPHSDKLRSLSGKQQRNLFHMERSYLRSADDASAELQQEYARNGSVPDHRELTDSGSLANPLKVLIKRLAGKKKQKR